MKYPKPKIVIELCGGEICGVYASNTDLSFTIVDWDELRPGEYLPASRVLPLKSASADVKEVLNSATKR